MWCLTHSIGLAKKFIWTFPYHLTILIFPYHLHWKDWWWSWNSNALATWCKELTHWKRRWWWERLKPVGDGTTKDGMVGWHHLLNGHEFKQSLGAGDGQGSLACCSLWSRKESETTEWPNWTDTILEKSLKEIYGQPTIFHFVILMKISFSLFFAHKWKQLMSIILYFVLEASP